ncbi:T9SS type A sorting domain-containing protein [Algibacter sp.]|nr:T9SS type A sorting domain-containing protein [bacterium]MDC1226148.1 T9SS type A sorting domain-containing protein [Algibacter sp.]MDC1276741.1 T9SS type A sorting domain-containing protein [Algibacter sp.]
MDPFKKISILFAFVFLTINVGNTQTVATTLDATVRDVSDVDFGFNRRSDNGTWWTDNSFINLVSEMNPDVVRYPGGTQANYWDWQEGKFLDNTDKTWNNKEVLKIPGFVAALPSRTKIVYVVNMARPTPATGVSVTASEEILKSDATLHLKIADMIYALDKFEEEGKLPYAVELGNEFYFGNEESGIFHIVENGGFFYSGWDSANDTPFQSLNKKDATDINAQFYLRQCKTIVTEIRNDYPNMKFALTTTKSGNGTSVRERWNNTIFDNLANNSEFTSLKPYVYAVTQHHYLNDNYGVQTVITDNATAKVAIAEGIQYPIDKQADYTMVPYDYKIWYTEYGEVKGIAEETWADAVRYAALNYSWLERGDKVNQLDFHYISDNTVVKVESPMRLAPVGIATKLFMTAFAEMTEMQRINFGTNPISVNGVESLFGYKFKNGTKETLLIININNTNFTDVQIGNLLSYSGSQTLTQYSSVAPYVSGVAEGDSNILSINSNITDTFNARRFSISVIEVNNTLSNNDFNQNNVSIYPNPVKDVLTIETNNTLKGVSVYNINGSRVFDIKNVSSKIIDLSTLNSGMYILKIETNETTEYKRLIKK